MAEKSLVLAKNDWKCSYLQYVVFEDIELWSRNKDRELLHAGIRRRRRTYWRTCRVLNIQRLVSLFLDPNSIKCIKWSLKNFKICLKTHFWSFNVFCEGILGISVKKQLFLWRKYLWNFWKKTPLVGWDNFVSSPQLFLGVSKCIRSLPASVGDGIDNAAKNFFRWVWLTNWSEYRNYLLKVRSQFRWHEAIESAH